MATNTHDDLYGGPTKRFFVSMLTRDISLEDAILDLIDNSVDGAIRQVGGSVRGPDAYQGYWAKLELHHDKFVIKDNCGGIPADRLSAAFRLGRPKDNLDENIPSIGVFGIGMKRAIFKLGKNATVKSRANDANVFVRYPTSWFELDDQETGEKSSIWDLEIDNLAPAKSKFGVELAVHELSEDVKRQFKNVSFIRDLETKISRYFGYLIARGFKIQINNRTAKGQTLKLFGMRSLDTPGINPFYFEEEYGGVNYRVTVGLYRRPLTDEDKDDSEAGKRPNLRSGITVICNDRVILDCDTTYKTGWGTRKVPQYHNQFAQIAGTIRFYSNDALKLPMSTTKTSVDIDRDVYQRAIESCAAGIKKFTDFTYQWKNEPTAARDELFEGSSLQPTFERDSEFKKHTKVKTLGSVKGAALIPNLPKLVKKSDDVAISFKRPKGEVAQLGQYLFAEPNASAKRVGVHCFELLLEEAGDDE